MGFVLSIIFGILLASSTTRNPDAEFNNVFLTLMAVMMAYLGAYSLWKWHKLAFPIEHAESD